MNQIIEQVAEATNLPQEADAQENRQNWGQPGGTGQMDGQDEGQSIETTATESEVPIAEVTGADERPPSINTVSEKLSETAAKPKIQSGMVAVVLLRHYARNAEIYENREDPLFTESIRQRGILTDLVVTEDGETLGGNRRLLEAKRLGLKEVPVKVVVCKTEDEKLLRVLDDNVQRQKTNEERAKEYTERLKVEARAAALRKVEAGKKAKGQEVKTVSHPTDEKGKARDKAAKVLNLSGVTAEKGRKVLEAVAKARAQDAAGVADELLGILNDKGFNAAFKRARANKLIPPSAPKKPTINGAANTEPVVPTRPATDKPAVAPKANVVAASAAPGAVNAVEDDLDPDVQIALNYIKAVEKLENLDVQQITPELRGNVLRAQEDADNWFAYNSVELGGAN